MNLLKIQFITDSRFQEYNTKSRGAMLKRALRAIQRKVGSSTTVVEVSDESKYPDAVFAVYGAGKQWILRKVGATKIGT